MSVQTIRAACAAFANNERGHALGQLARRAGAEGNGRVNALPFARLRSVMNRDALGCTSKLTSDSPRYFDFAKYLTPGKCLKSASNVTS